MKIYSEHTQFAESIADDLQHVDEEQIGKVMHTIKDSVDLLLIDNSLVPADDWGQYADRIVGDLATQCEGNQKRMEKFWKGVVQELVRLRIEGKLTNRNG